MRFQELAGVLGEIEGESSRLKMTEILAGLWSRLALEEVALVANLTAGQLQPAYESLEFNLSEKMIARTLARLVLAAGGLEGVGLAQDLFGHADEDTALQQVRGRYREWGDWGQTAEKIHFELLGKKESQITIEEVFAKLKKIAHENGAGSMERKLVGLVELYEQVDSAGAKVITRVVIGKLRLGFSLMTILDSLSWAGTGSKSESRALEEVWQKKADIGMLANSYCQLLGTTTTERLEKLHQNYQVAVGVPVVAALCQRLNSSGEIIEKMGEVIAEPKYDGMRVQIHIRQAQGEPQVSAFTRNLENVSSMFPELNKLAARLNLKEGAGIILDSEVLGVNVKTGGFLPFQEMMQRRRKHLITETAAAVPVKFLIFDLLFWGKEELLAWPLLERKQLLSKVVPETKWSQVTPYLITSDEQILRTYHELQLKNGLEGVVAKGKESVYQSGRKGWQWVKIKEEEGTRGKLNDTLDLAVLGVYWGRGKRHDLGVGAFLVGLENEAGEWVTISKIGTGLSDECLRELKQKAEELKVASKPKNYLVNPLLTPDVWLSGELVAEIAADELTNSTNHTSGYGLRFPRLLRWREDKTKQEATKISELAAIAKK